MMPCRAQTKPPHEAKVFDSVPMTRSMSRGIDAGLLAQAAAGVAEHADRMRLVDEKPYAVLFLDLAQPFQIDRVAVHRIEAFDNDQDVAERLAPFGEDVVEVIEVVVAEDDRLGRRATAAAGDAVVGQFIQQDGVAAAHQMGQHRHVREVARDQ